MERKTINILLTVASACLAAAGLIFLAISIFGSSESNTPLAVALACIVLGNLFNLIRIQQNRSKP